MVLVVAAPLATADTHLVVKGSQGPRASAVSWEFVPSENGRWNGHVVNSGLRSLVVDVDDVTSGTPNSVLHQRIRFAAYQTDTLDTNVVFMTKDRTYSITATPNGPSGSSCTVEDVFVIIPPHGAVFTYMVSGLYVIVDASGSGDPDGSVVAYGWDWGDGTTGTGMITQHGYAEAGTYTIVLTVMDNDGITYSTSHDVTLTDYPPSPVFTVTVNSLTVYADASASTDDWGIVSYMWNWGDGSPDESGVTATHTYASAVPILKTITLTIVDTSGQIATLSKDVSIDGMPP